MSTKNIIGNNIKKYRNLENISQEQLIARLQIQGLDLDRTMLSKMENQIRPIFDFEVEAIAKALNIPISKLFDQKK